MEPHVIKNRLWNLIDFDRSKIENAIQKNCDANNFYQQDFAKNLTDQVMESLKLNNSRSYSWDSELNIITIEDIQDEIEIRLMNSWHIQLMKSFILYRNERIKEREKQKEKLEKKLATNTLKVTKSDGSKELFDMGKIKTTYQKIVNWLEKECPFEDIEKVMKTYIIDWIKTSDIIKLLIKASIDLISVENIKWQNIAGRFLAIDLYKEATKNRKMILDDIYTGSSFKEFFDLYIKKGLYYKDFYNYYSEEDIVKAGEYINWDRDLEYNYSTLLMLKKRYLLNPNKIVMELPQEMYMAIALFLAIPEEKTKRLSIAKKIYEYCSSRKISLPTPTLLNARTNFHQLSSCFKLNVEDDLRAIYHNIENMAQISKFGGWIWVYLWNLRSKGWTIRGVHWASWWVNPWIKVINDTAVAVNQLGRRRGRISLTLDIWHKDIYDFLDLQTETGDIRRKAFDIFPAVAIPDLFMKRLKEDGEWSLFDPKEIEDVYWKRIQDTYWEEFELFYKDAEQNSKLKLKDIVKAKDLFKKFMKTVVETGMPYTFFRDTANALNPNKHAGMIYNSQLCLAWDTKVTIKIDWIEKEIDLKDVGDLMKKNKDVFVLSENLKIGNAEFKKITDFAMTSPKAKVMKITDDSWKEIICTSSHLVYTINRWYVEAWSLVETDELLLN